MKKILTTIIVLILFVSCGQDKHWRTISPKGLDGQFNDILFINESTGWIVGTKGRTQINGLPSRWFRMTDNEEGTTYETVQYVIQSTSDKVYLLNCSATKDTYTDFEEEFNKIVFSYKRLD